MYRDPADQPEHICAELGETQPDCNSYYCRLEREAAELAAALAGGETALDAEAQAEADATAIIDWELTVNAAHWRARWEARA